jgi:hypothetical protein
VRQRHPLEIATRASFLSPLMHRDAFPQSGAGRART